MSANYKYKVQINGRKAANGKLYCSTISGEVENPNEVDIYGVLSDLIHEVEEQNKDMALPHSIQITLVPE